MKFIFTEPFQKDYQQLPSQIQRALDKALSFLSTDRQRSSLRIKKLPGTMIWYARITRAYRFTFQFEKEIIILRRVGTHAILNRERKN